MSPRSRSRQVAQVDIRTSVPPLLNQAALAVVLDELLRAQAYADDLRQDRWDFAVELDAFRGYGMTRTDLRWLVCKGYLEHRREVTRRGAGRREFKPENELLFSKRSCFVLTRTGQRFARVFCAHARAPTEIQPDAVRLVSPAPGEPAINRQPVWDAQRHELRVADVIVKRFRWPAANQETVLAAFEEEHWSARIDDPLPPKADQDPKRRLHDTIKCLNRRQEQPLMRFKGDGSGEGVLWEFTDESAAH